MKIYFILLYFKRCNVSGIDDILCEFFEVVIHNILNSRKLYPETIFELRKKYGIPVYICIHPDLKDYINECLKAVNFFISKRQLHKIFICFHSGKSILERYTFDILDVNDLVKRYSSSFLDNIKTLWFFSDLFLVKLEQSMRTCILKLNASLSYMKNLPEKSTFSIRLLTNCYTSFEFNQDPNHQVKNIFPTSYFSIKKCF